MRKFLCLMVVFLAAAGLGFAAWTGENLGGGGNEAVDVTLNLKSGDENIPKSYKVGFAPSAVSNFDEVSGDITTSAALTVDDDAETASLENVYVYWQIAGPDALEISLTWDENMAADGAPDKKLSWTVATVPEASGGTGNEINNGTPAGEDSHVILDRGSENIENGGFLYKTVGSQKVNITVSDIYSQGIEDFKGTLTLTVAAESGIGG